MIKPALDLASDGGCITALVEKGRKWGYVTIEEIMECLPTEISEIDQINDIVTLIEDMGIEVAR